MVNYELLHFFFLMMLFLLICLIVIWTIKNGISPMPTSPKARQQLLKLLPEKLEGTIYELGSGWGGLALTLARRYPDSNVIGYENSPIVYGTSKCFLICSSCPNLELKYADFYGKELQDAALIVCYLFPKAMERLSVKFKHELKPGTLIASNTFALPNWQPEKVLEIDDFFHTKIYLYRV